jgi:hypothetical protein
MGRVAAESRTIVGSNIGEKEIAKYGRAQRPPEAQRRSSK